MSKKNTTNLRRIRKSRCLSQQQLAYLAKVSVNNIQAYEQGKRDINKAEADTLYRLSKALYCSMEELLEKDVL